MSHHVSLQVQQGELAHVPCAFHSHAALGLKGTAARVIIRRALAEDLVSSVTEKSPLRIAFPHAVLEAWFPQLFTNLPVND